MHQVSLSLLLVHGDLLSSRLALIPLLWVFFFFFVSYYFSHSADATLPRLSVKVANKGFCFPPSPPCPPSHPSLTFAGRDRQWGRRGGETDGLRESFFKPVIRLLALTLPPTEGAHLNFSFFSASFRVCRSYLPHPVSVSVMSN